MPPCLSCGACCFSTLERYVRVTGDDHARLGERADELSRFDGHRAYMRMIDGHCVALRVQGARGELRCDAYAIRPDICRDLARSSDACLGERATKSERPLIALRRAALT
ncbi:MAG: YkgJ family cysteine cluster protein [Sandaracinaceae bacterium]|nr:zinc/iron-chelating domain-containing protein [Myxococcales bacterium]